MTTEEIFGSDIKGDSQSNNSDYNNGKPDFSFEGGPLLTNGDWVAYPDKDKNGNWFLRVRNQNVPGLKFQLFVNNGAHDGLDRYFNKMCDDFNQK